MFRARLLFLAVFPLLAVAAACSGTGTTDTQSPITGVTVRADSLTVGRGCGRGTTQIFKYAVVVLGLTTPATPTAPAKVDTFIAGGIYDCFSDAQFVSLPPSAQSFQYDVNVYAYNEAAFNDASTTTGISPTAQGWTTLPQTNPTFTTKCLTEQIPGVQSLASCKPVAPGVAGLEMTVADATVELSAASFDRVGGGKATCNVDYTTVAYRSGTDPNNLGAITTAPCSRTTDGGVEPLTIKVSPAVAPAKYTIEVGLVRSDMTALGQTTCGAETKPGQTSAATCAPIP